tara:strand:- start:225 stop:737 length:513 start_codon:yes stop_codon:yes gene_type:complete
VKDYLKFEQTPKLRLKNDIAALSRINDRLTEENFILFKKLILDSLPYEDEAAHDQKYSVTTYRLTNPELPSIEVCIENLSRYTKHAYMCINSINRTGNVYFRPYTFRTKIYMDAKLIEVYDLSDDNLRNQSQSGISTSLLNKPNMNDKIILSAMFNDWLSELISLNYRIS